MVKLVVKERVSKKQGMAQPKDIYMDWIASEEPPFMGVLHSEVIRGEEVFSYENDPTWLKHTEFCALDTDL